MTYHVIFFLSADGSTQAGVGKRSGAIRFGPTASDAGHARETGVEPEEEDGRAAPEARERADQRVDAAAEGSRRNSRQKGTKDPSSFAKCR